jgi:multiple sugar transport system ATP-binding protein
VTVASITVTGLTVVKGGRPVLDAVDLHVDDGELLAVIGPSGSGKTSLLRAIAGLDRPDSGEVMLGDDVVTRLEPQERAVAMVFQNSVLYPFLTARENVAFPLRVRHRPPEEVELRVTAEGRAMGIEALFDAKPSQLSAGQHQLVQIAKAMVRTPRAMLFDEPLAMVDAKARVAMRTELRTVQHGYGVTAIYVTNDPVEAMAMGDRVAVMAAGRVIQVGTPGEVYAAPATVEIAEVTGDIGLVTARVEVDPPGFVLVAGSLRLRAWAEALGGRTGHTVVVGVRPEDILVGPDVAGGEGRLPATVTMVEPLGHHDMVMLDFGGAQLRARLHPGATRRRDQVTATIRHHILFDPETGERIG